MRIKDPRTGKEARIRDVDAYCKDSAALWQRCSHDRTELRRWTNANGAVAIQVQCLVCGVRVGKPQKADGHDNLSPAEPVIRDQYEAARKLAYEALVIRYIDQSTDDDTTFWKEYDAYLQTPEWKARRAKVLKRCGGICEGCRDAPATVAHHLTYDHVFDELLFELVGLCQPCHDKAHAESEAEEAEPE
jgi:hypothetical protein